jgi:hypothetical protein
MADVLRYAPARAELDDIADTGGAEGIVDEDVCWGGEILSIGNS